MLELKLIHVLKGTPIVKIVVKISVAMLEFVQTVFI